MGDKSIMKQDVQKEIEEFNKNIDKYYEEKRVLFLDDQLFYIASITEGVKIVFLKHNSVYNSLRVIEDFIEKNHLFTTNYDAHASFNKFYGLTSERAKATSIPLLYDKIFSIVMDRMTFYRNAYGSLHTTSVNLYGEFLDK